MSGVDERDETLLSLGICQEMESENALARTRRADQLGNATTGKTVDAGREVER
jgi:hypothetical protein